MSDSGDYDTRALRFESHLGIFKVIRGGDGTVVAKAEWFRRFDLASIVAPSERALAEAREFSRNRTPGVWMASLGFLVFAAGAIMLKATRELNAFSVVTGLIGTALMVYGAGRLEEAGEALSKSLWWYNRDLKENESPSSIVVKK